MKQHKTYLALIAVTSILLLAGCIHSQSINDPGNKSDNESNGKDFLTNYTINNSSWVTRADWNYTHSDLVLDEPGLRCSGPREHGYRRPYDIRRKTVDETFHNYSEVESFLMNQAINDFQDIHTFLQNDSLILTEIKPRKMSIRNKTIRVEKRYRPDAIYFLNHTGNVANFGNTSTTVGVFVKYKGPYRGTTIFLNYVAEDCYIRSE